MTSFWGELKRRNVVRVAVAYAVVAWLLLQVADVVLDNIEAPTWVFQAILLLLLIGFPVAIIFAWAFELTPEGLKKEEDVDRSESITHVTGRKLDFIIIGVLLVAVGFLLVDKIYLSEVDTAPDEIIATERQSIAVLPFVNMSSDPEQEYFSDGLSEEILNLLAKIPELKVIGRTSSFAFKGKNEDLRLIGEALGVKTVLEGSVRKSGDRVRITAQLIDVSDASHIWSETYDRTLDDIFAVQDDVAAAIIVALQIHVGAIPTRGRPTENSDAYALFLKARIATSVYNWLGSEELLFEAIKLDPKFAEAYELLASIYWHMSGTTYKAPEAQRLSGEAAAKALAIDPDLVLANALYSMGNLESYSLLGEIEALELAAQVEPDNLMILDTLFFNLLKTGYFQESLTIARRLIELDPLSPSANGRLPAALFALERNREGFAAVDHFARVDPELEYWYVGEANLAHGRDQIAISRFEAALGQEGYPDTTWLTDLVTRGRDVSIGQAYFDQRIPEISASVPVEFAIQIQWRLSFWYLYFGFLDRYFELIPELDLTDETWTDADDFVTAGVSNPQLGFRAHPKYLGVAEKLGHIDIWEQRGPPDFCEKVDGKWTCE